MGYSHLCQMEIQNIFNLKGYHNLKNCGQSLIIDFISNLFGCEVHLYHVPIKKFEELLGVDITSNIFRSCYTIDDNTRVIKIKVYEEKNIVAIMPVVLSGESVKHIENRYLEDLCNTLSKQMTACYNNSFHGGIFLFGEQLEKLVIGACICAKKYDLTRIIYLIELIEKLSTTTFEGSYFTTGFILSRSLYAYKGKKRNGNLVRQKQYSDIVRKPSIEKRFWYLVDGKESFYIMDQNFIIKDMFIRSHVLNSWEEFFSSHLLTDTLLGDDIAFRVVGPNEISIVNSIGIEFVKIENKWRLRDFNSINAYFQRAWHANDKVREALIYYITLCSRKHSSSIIWIPDVCDNASIDLLISTKNKLFEKPVNITKQNHSGLINRILSSDGVTIIDKTGDILYCGCIVKLDVDASKGLMGTGESAARTLSQNGVAVKISQDGNIKIFSTPDKAPFIY